MRTALDTETPPPPVAPPAPRPKEPTKQELLAKNAELERIIAEFQSRSAARPAAVHADDIRIDQGHQTMRDGDSRKEVVRADLSMMDPDYLARIAFMEEPVEIEIHASGAENPVDSYFCAINGVGAEVLMEDGQWMSITWVPVGVKMTLKRKYVGVLAGSKLTNVRTEIKDEHADRPRNLTHKTTSGMCNFTVHTDPNPRGAAWLAETRRRHF